MGVEAGAAGGDFASIRARLDALALETLDDEDQLRGLRVELDQLSRSLGAAREAADAASVEVQLRRLRKEEPRRRAQRLRGLLSIYAGAIDALEELSDPATATFILRLELRRARVAEELVTTEARFPDLHVS
jgi:phosphoglycolate phosphatase-like HAD superfamily hydrolase